EDFRDVFAFLDFFAFFDADLGDGTFAPFFRASLKPMAIACLRLVTFCPELLFNVPRFFRRTADATVFDAAFPYLAIAFSSRASEAGARGQPADTAGARHARPAHDARTIERLSGRDLAANLLLRQDRPCLHAPRAAEDSRAERIPVEERLGVPQASFFQ